MLINNKIPIIFIHKGDSNFLNGIGNYLQYTLKFARRFNPNTEIILLGDESNNKYQKYDIKHFNFSKYDDRKDIIEFNKIFQFIRNNTGLKESTKKLKKIKEFEKFCFLRWFYLYYFLEENGIDKCWYFDSNTLILTDLSAHQNKYKEYDCTEQCNGSCMKGLINNIQVLKGYI